MKQILIAALLFFISYSAKAQSIICNNSTGCNIYLQFVGANSGCNDFDAHFYVVLPGVTTTFDMFTGGIGTLLTWSVGTPTPGTAYFTYLKFFDFDPTSGSCTPGIGSGGSGCHYDANLVGDGTCRSSSACLEVSSAIGSCATCSTGTVINANWTNLGSGNVKVDFN